MGQTKDSEVAHSHSNVRENESAYSSDLNVIDGSELFSCKDETTIHEEDVKKWVVFEMKI